MAGGGLSPAGLKDLDTRLQRAVAGREVPGLVALVQRGEDTAVFAHGHMGLGRQGRMPSDAIFRIASMTKPITAVAALTLVDEGVLHIGTAVDELLPEVAHPQVLKNPLSQLNATVAAKSSITIQHLLTYSMGLGGLCPPDDRPIEVEIKKRGLDGLEGPDLSLDDWMKRFGPWPNKSQDPSLPLAHQPGTKWLYHMSGDVLGVLIYRAISRRQSLAEFMKDRIFDPLDMKSTGYCLKPDEIDRLPARCRCNDKGDLEPWAETRDWTRLPNFISGAGWPSMLSTAEDYSKFLRMLLNKGEYNGKRIISENSVKEMTKGHLSESQKAETCGLLGPTDNWGYGLAVNGDWFGWSGAVGTDAWADKRKDLVGILMTQVATPLSKEQPELFKNARELMYAAAN